ncbi:MAG: ADP-ribosylglycohydrolase family protein [Armatimonadetes bacterium]|nr:ADP-ribosylglycohydrolase family protein [Armatimonadota bacterium]
MLSRERLVDLARAELIQLKEEGRRVGGLDEELARIEASPPDGQCRALSAFFEAAAGLPTRDDWPYEEPSELGEIRRVRPDGPRHLPTPSREELADRILGAWLGRCAGCMLGKPVEGFTRDRLEALLRAAGAWELDGYFPPAQDLPEGLSYHPGVESLLRGNITRAVRDDDTDYTVIGLHILEENGPDFTPRDVAEQWLAHFPYRCVCTAEHEAYRNFVVDIWPPQSAVHLNPYREWIGAQIRADAWGYAAPGWPEKAAEFAWRDACISHTKNGIYGEMFFAALIAAALSADDLREAIAAAAAEIPVRCRLRECIDDCLEWCRQDDDWKITWERINAKYGHYHPVHTINNAALVLMGLLHSGGDFSRAICIAVMGGWDTDCNGATAGSVMGALLGAKGIPPHWVDPLNDILESSLQGMNFNRISDLAARTLVVAQQVSG